jgi:hypothetical protein
MFWTWKNQSNKLQMFVLQWKKACTFERRLVIYMSLIMLKILNDASRPIHQTVKIVPDKDLQDKIDSIGRISEALALDTLDFPTVLENLESVYGDHNKDTGEPDGAAEGTDTPNPKEGSPGS